MTSPLGAADAIGPPATLPASYDPTLATLNGTSVGKPTEMLDSQAFLQLLVAQLKYQDPTSPVDTSNFMNQTAMLSQVQTMNSMSATLTDMFTAQQTASATSLLGKAISFVNPSGEQVAGIVDAMSMNKGVAMLHVGDLAVPLAGVLAVAEPVAEPVPEPVPEPLAEPVAVDETALDDPITDPVDSSPDTASPDTDSPDTDSPDITEPQPLTV